MLADDAFYATLPHGPLTLARSLGEIKVPVAILIGDQDDKMFRG